MAGGRQTLGEAGRQRPWLPWELTAERAFAHEGGAEAGQRGLP